jgi:hypothetical protein
MQETLFNPTQFFRLLKEMRRLNLSFANSSISEDITFKVLDHYFNEKELPVKILFADLPYSLMGMRNHFDMLIKNNWIELKKSDKDARVRLVIPTKNLIKQIHLLTENFKKTFSENNICVIQ